MGQQMKNYSRRPSGGGSIFRSVFYPIPINKTAVMVSCFIDRNRKSTTAKSKPKTQPKTKTQPRTKDDYFVNFPRIAYFRIQYSQTYLKTFDMPWIILVSCRGDGKGLRLISDVGYDFGKEIKECFKTREEAIAVGLEMKKKWGRGLEVTNIKENGVKNEKEKKTEEPLAD